MKTTSLLFGLLSAAMLAFAIPAQGQIVTASATAPTTSGDDINNIISGSISGDDYTNHNPPGQTFLTGGAGGGYLLNSITVEGGGNAGGYENALFSLTIYSVSGTALTLVDYENYFIPDDSASDYLTFTPDSPVSLAANTEYAFTIGNMPDGYGGITNPSSWFGFVDSNATGSTYANGTAIGATLPASGSLTSTSIATTEPYDMSFAVSLSETPEPSAWAMMAGGVAVLAGILFLRHRTI